MGISSHRLIRPSREPLMRRLVPHFSLTRMIDGWKQITQQGVDFFYLTPSSCVPCTVQFTGYGHISTVVIWKVTVTCTINQNKDSSWYGTGASVWWGPWGYPLTFFFFFFWNPLLCAFGYRTLCSTSRLYVHLVCIYSVQFYLRCNLPRGLKKADLM